MSDRMKSLLEQIRAFTEDDAFTSEILKAPLGRIIRYKVGSLFSQKSKAAIKTARGWRYLQPLSASGSLLGAEPAHIGGRF